MSERTERVNVIFPKELLRELRKHVPPRERSALIVRATERELRRVRLLAALGALRLAPAWMAEEHPDLADAAAIDRVLAEERATYRARHGDE